jgi:hypothetical protein
MSDFRNFLQGASNSAASGVSAPVDVLAWLMRKAGMGGMIGNAPVGGSEWMAQKGLTADAPGKAGLLGEAIGGVVPLLGAAKAPQIAGGLLKAESNLANSKPMFPGPGNAQRGAVVFHGSPHSFDRFDMSKIGTGEGAQAYGHGLYFAENPGVATSYTAANASGGRPIAHLDGKAIADIPNKSGVLDWLDSYGSIANTRAALAGRKPELAKELDELVKSGRLTEGNLYKVDLPDEHIAKMLDWDKPLSQQPKEVQAAMDRAFQSHLGRIPQVNRDAFTGAQAINMLTGGASGMHGYENVAAQGTAALRKAGIPGIRYLDGGSRGAGAGTSNYVVFDDKLPKILERNGQGLLSGR